MHLQQGLCFTQAVPLRFSTRTQPACTLRWASGKNYLPQFRIQPSACSKKDEEPSPLDGRIKDVLQKSLSETSLPVEELRASDRRVMDGITEVGMEKIRGIASETKGDLEALIVESQQKASELIEEQTDALLAKYEGKQRDILDGVEKEKEVIRKEAQLIEELSRQLNTTQTTKAESRAANILATSTALFGVAALFYGWNGVVDSDSASLQSAALDAMVAAASGFFLGRQKREE